MSKFSQFAFYMCLSLPVVSKSLAQWFLTGEACLPRGGVKRFHGFSKAWLLLRVGATMISRYIRHFPLFLLSWERIRAWKILPKIFWFKA